VKGVISLSLDGVLQPEKSMLLVDDTGDHRVEVQMLS